VSVSTETLNPRVVAYFVNSGFPVLAVSRAIIPQLSKQNELALSSDGWRNIAITLIEPVLGQNPGSDHSLIPRPRAGRFSVGVIAVITSR
jgi:hypothetical protein